MMEAMVATRISTTALNFENKAEMTVSFEFHPEANGYLGRCPELEAVAWGRTLAEAKKELLDAIIDTAEVLVEQSNETDFQIDPRLKYAEVVTSCGTKRQIKELIGL
jgi:predicted RNase H-like HicB family nuclease